MVGCQAFLPFAQLVPVQPARLSLVGQLPRAAAVANIIIPRIKCPAVIGGGFDLVGIQGGKYPWCTNLILPKLRNTLRNRKSIASLMQDVIAHMGKIFRIPAMPFTNFIPFVCCQCNGIPDVGKNSHNRTTKHTGKIRIICEPKP